jgi:hypothetical protein
MAKNEMDFHVKQHAIHRATLAGLKADGFYPEPLLKQLSQLSDELFEATDYAFKYGEPAEYQKRAATMNTFMATIVEIQHHTKHLKHK